MVDLVEERVEQGKNQINNAQNFINMAYYIGKQYIHWDQVNKKVIEASNEENKTRYVANRIQKIVRTELAKITKNKPVMDCVPASSEEEDIRASKIGDQILDYLEYKHDLHNQVDKKAIMWGLTTEFGIVHPYWDSGTGERIPDPSTPGQFVRGGDEKVDILSPFELIFDDEAKTWKEISWFIKPKVRKTAYIKKKYGVDVASDDSVDYNTGIAKQMDSLYAKYGQVATKKAKDAVTIYEYWEAPSDDYENGRRIAIAGGQLLYSLKDIGFGPEDDSERVLPFFPFTHIDVPGRIQGQSMVENLIPIQKEYNRSRSQIIDNKDLMSNPIWLIQDGAVDDIDDIPNQAGGILLYNEGFPVPQRDQPPAMGMDVYKNLEQLVEEFYFISGQQEVSHGSTPSGVTSGVAISFLQEQDNTVIAPTISNFIACKRGYMSYMLKMIKYKYDYERKLKIVGDNKRVNMLQFIGSNLTSTDVRIVEGSMFQDSKPAKQNWITNLIQLQVLNPERDRDMIIRMLELGMTEDMYDQSQIDIDQARKEQLLWEKKAFEETIVRDFYNHQVHLMEHDRFRKGDIYDGLESQEQLAVDSHILEHQVFIQQEIMRQMANQMAMNPPVGGNGGNKDGDMSKMPGGAEGENVTNG